MSKVVSSSNPNKLRIIDTDDNTDQKEYIPVSKLENPVQELLSEVFKPHLEVLAGVQYQQQNLPKPDFMLNLDKMPWGHLKHEEILDACCVITKIMTFLEDTNNNGVSEFDLDDLTYYFHTIITKHFGSDFRIPLLDNPDPLFQIKLRVLKFFLDSQLGYVLLVEVDKIGHRYQTPAPMDLRYINLQSDIKYVDPVTEMGDIITKYFRRTLSSNSSVPFRDFERFVEIENIFAVERHDEDKRFEPYQNQNNRKLLWHASNIANFVGILSTGLRLTQAKGGFFGKGPDGKNIVKYLGSWVPDPSEYVVRPNGIGHPLWHPNSTPH